MNDYSDIADKDRDTTAASTGNHAQLREGETPDAMGHAAANAAMVAKAERELDDEQLEEARR